VDQHTVCQVSPLVHRILIRKLLGIEGAYDYPLYATPEAYSIAKMGYLAVGVFHYASLTQGQAYFAAPQCGEISSGIQLTGVDQLPQPSE